MAIAVGTKRPRSSTSDDISFEYTGDDFDDASIASNAIQCSPMIQSLEKGVYMMPSWTILICNTSRISGFLPA